MPLTEEEIEHLELKEKFKDLEVEINDYIYLLNIIGSTDVKSDKLFRKHFYKFNKVKRNEKWNNYFYGIFSDIKSGKLNDFKTILEKVVSDGWNCEYTTITKMLSVVNPNTVIIDKYTLNNFNLKMNHKLDKTIRVQWIVELYEKLVKKMQEFLNYQPNKDFIDAFHLCFFDTDYDDISYEMKIYFEIIFDSR
ncbi:MAG: hypothetical protein LBM99_04840 [Bacillales bacterium]|jgi:hypothetical protein|nr:hypothetical protein [Bacillales bacterium]